MIKKETSKPILENITNKELEAYKNILKLKDIEDIDNIIFKYKNALEDYFLEDIYDLDRLKKIINAFTYFTNFDKNISLEEKNNLILKSFEILKKGESSTFFNSEIILCLVFNIMNKLGDNIEILESFIKPLQEILSTIEPIYEYEKSRQKIK